MWRALVVVVLLTVSTLARADVPISDEARREFNAGVGLLEESDGPRYREAYEAFQRAYTASPSPKMLSNIGLCAMMLERDGEAIDAYERYLREAQDVDPREREKIQRDLATLRAGVARLALTIEPREAVIVDTRTPPSGAPVVNRYEIDNGVLELGIRAGKHRIEVQAPDRQPEAWSFDVAPGKRHTRKVVLRGGTGSVVAPGPSGTVAPSPSPSPSPAAPDSDGGLSPGTIAAIAITGAMVVGAVITGSLALKYQSDYKSFENGGDRQEAESVRSTGQALNITTDVLIGVAIAGAAVTTVLLVLDLSKDSEAAFDGTVFRF